MDDKKVVFWLFLLLSSVPWLDNGKQQLGTAANHSLQSKCNMENANIRAAMAMVEGAYNKEQRSAKEKR